MNKADKDSASKESISIKKKIIVPVTIFDKFFYFFLLCIPETFFLFLIWFEYNPLKIGKTLNHFDTIFVCVPQMHFFIKIWSI